MKQAGISVERKGLAYDKNGAGGRNQSNQAEAPTASGAVVGSETPARAHSAGLWIGISSINRASAEVAANRSGTARLRTQTICPALSATGQALRWLGEISWASRPDCSSSFSFFGARVLAGKNRSPARQFRMVSSGPIR